MKFQSEHEFGESNFCSFYVLLYDKTETAELDVVPSLYDDPGKKWRVRLQ